LKETRLVVGDFPYKLLNGDVVVPLWAVNFGKQILDSSLWFASLALISSRFTLLLLDLLGCACLLVQGSLPVTPGFRKINQVHTYMYARIKFHTYSRHK
jgi:hypothetical protein